MVLTAAYICAPVNFFFLVAAEDVRVRGGDAGSARAVLGQL